MSRKRRDIPANESPISWGGGDDVLEPVTQRHIDYTVHRRTQSAGPVPFSPPFSSPEDSDNEHGFQCKSPLPDTSPDQNATPLRESWLVHCGFVFHHHAKMLIVRYSDSSGDVEVFRRARESTAAISRTWVTSVVQGTDFEELADIVQKAAAAVITLHMITAIVLKANEVTVLTVTAAIVLKAIAAMMIALIAITPTVFKTLPTTTKQILAREIPCGRAMKIPTKAKRQKPHLAEPTEEIAFSAQGYLQSLSIIM